MQHPKPEPAHQQQQVLKPEYQQQQAQQRCRRCNLGEWIKYNMFITELYEPLPELYHSERDDQTPMKLSDLRKTRLTLGHLNKLRMATDIRKFEKEEEIKGLQDQYKAAAADAGGAPPM